MSTLMIIAIRKDQSLLEKLFGLKKRTRFINIELLEYYSYLFDDP